MILALKLFLNILIVGLFLYSKLLPHNDRLNVRYKSVYNFFKSILEPVLTMLRPLLKPFLVGQGLSVDMTQIVLLISLLALNFYI